MKTPSRNSVVILVIVTPVLLAVALSICRSSVPAIIRGKLYGEPFYAGAPVCWWIERASTRRSHFLDIFAPHGPSSSIGEQYVAGCVLKRMAKEGHPEGVRILIEVLGNGNVLLVGSSASELLRELGPQDTAAVTALVKIIRDRKSANGDAAARALGQIDSTTAVEVLMEMLEDRNRDRRCWAANRLGEIGREARVAIPALVKMMDESSTEEAARSALDKIDPTHSRRME